MITKTLTALVILVLLISNTLIFNRHSAVKKLAEELTLELEQVNNDVGILSHAIIQSKALNGIDFSDIALLSEVNEKISFNKFADNTLFIYYDETHCSDCLKSIFQRLDKNNVHKAFEIIVVAHFHVQADFLRFEKVHNPLQLRFLNFQNSDLPQSLVSLSEPFIFNLNEKTKIVNAFIPKKSMPDITSEYCKNILLPKL